MEYFLAILMYLLIFLPPLLVIVDFLKFLITGKRLFNKNTERALEIIETIVLLLMPVTFLVLGDENENNCCGETAIFSPDHKLTIYAFIAICLLAYSISRSKKGILSPIVEVLINSILLLGIIFNIAIAIQIDIDIELSITGNLPIILLFTLQLIKNQKQFIEYSESNSVNAGNSYEKLAWKVLNLKPIFKIPLLLVLCLPIMVLISSLLLLFGQKPDSIIRAFTDTYKQGFSQLDYLCANVDCGEHFLCSVAANGHKGIVKPIRYGERHGGKIICNRQLLMANAFEELIEQKFPKIHKVIRRNYNKVGHVIHRYYGIFNNKYLADFIYLMMKPLELIFWLTLYTFDKRPEDRIARQYLAASDRQSINEQIKG